MITKNAPWNQESHIIVPSCFVAGTMVTVDGGSLAIEDVREGTRILSNANSASYGIASDEDVVIPINGITPLVGINGEKAFFTPAHVFHTTTGLRAVAPYTAQRENPWIKVGKLLPGHVIYRLKEDGSGYDLVEIKALNREVVMVGQVYGIHLREGDRRYHANGYLVAVNYPEVVTYSLAGPNRRC
jgi:hypothetical protein